MREVQYLSLLRTAMITRFLLHFPHELRPVSRGVYNRVSYVDRESPRVIIPTYAQRLVYCRSRTIPHSPRTRRRDNESAVRCRKYLLR